jgi:hypothetical protein
VLPDVVTNPDGLDPRTTPPRRAAERETLAFLRRQRETLELKCAGPNPVALACRGSCAVG